MRSHLTDVSVRALPPSDKQLKVWDTKTPGFGVRINGRTKSWIVMYGAARTQKVLGRYPDLSLADARKQALVYLGTQPKPSKTIKFEEALKNFYDVHVPTLKPRTQYQLKRILDRHFAGPFKGKRLDQIEYRDITDITDELAKKTPSEAWHAFKDVRTFFRWCVPKYIRHAPTEGLKSPTKYIARKRVLTDNELLKVWQGAGDIGYPFGTAIQLSLLWGTRWGETVGCRWPFVNEKTRTITLPETKNRSEHHFPYGDMTAQILEEIPHLNSTDLLFPGRDGCTPWNGAGKAKWQMKETVVIAPWKLLDLRRTFATKVAEIEIDERIAVQPHIIERLLNHKVGTLQSEGVITAVAEVYNRARYLGEMREAIRLWERRLHTLLAA